MRRLVLVLAVLAPIAVVSVQPASAAKKKPTCSVKGSKTVVKTKSARVFTVKSRRADEVGRLYGCLNSTGRRTQLDTSRDDGFGVTVKFSQVSLSGRYVTWEHVVTDVSCRAACPPDYDPTSEVIGLTDLRRRTTKAIPGNPRAGSLKVDSRGTVSWIDTATGEPRSQAR
jgi:hypothetical protein